MNIRNPKSLVSLLACIAVILAWFSPWWLGGKNLAPLDLQSRMLHSWRDGNPHGFAKNHMVADAVDQYLVYRLIAEKSYRNEGWVGWSSLTYGGTAQYANTMALYADWTMQLHRWFDFWTAWHLGLMAQVMLAACGMWFFLKGRGINDLWAACGGLAYAANSQFVTWIYHRWALGSFCWVPWILWAIDGYRRGNRNHWAAVPLFTGMALLGGSLQHAALVALAVAAMWLEEAIRVRSRPLPVQARILLRYSVWGVLGCGLAGMMLLPCADAFLTSNRLGLHTGMHGNASNGVYPQGWLQPLFNLAAYPFQIFPSVLGRCDSVDVLKLFKSELFYVCYFGSLPILIGFLAIRGKDSPALARILAAAGLLLPLTPVVRLLYQRLFLLFIIGGILAFAAYMQHATRETRLRLFQIAAIVTTAGVIIWTTLSLVLLTQSGRLQLLRDRIVAEGRGSSFGYFESWLAQRAENFTNDLFIWSPQQLFPLLLLAATLAGLRFTASKAGSRRNIGAWMVAVAVLAEVSLFAARWIVWSDPSASPLFPETSETRILLEKVKGTGRVTTLIHPDAHMTRTPFIPNTLAAYDIATISGYDSIIPDGMLRPNEKPGDAIRLGRLGVSHLVTWAGNPDVPTEWNLLWSGKLMDLYQNPVALPRYAGFTSDAAKTAFLSGAGSGLLPITEITGKENTRLLDVPAHTRWVRIAENHASGWEYRPLDSGDWIAVQRAGDGSMLLENPDSVTRTMIEMRYDPPLRKWGFAVSAGALLLTAIGAFASSAGRPPMTAGPMHS